MTLHSLQNVVQWTLESFVEVHRNQLETSAVPRDTWPALFRKIAGQVFDAGSAFSLMRLEDDGGALTGWKAVVVKEGGVRCDIQISGRLILSWVERLIELLKA